MKTDRMHNRIARWYDKPNLGGSWHVTVDTSHNDGHHAVLIHHAIVNGVRQHNADIRIVTEGRQIK